MANKRVVGDDEFLEILKKYDGKMTYYRQLLEDTGYWSRNSIAWRLREFEERKLISKRRIPYKGVVINILVDKIPPKKKGYRRCELARQKREEAAK